MMDLSKRDQQVFSHLLKPDMALQHRHVPESCFFLLKVVVSDRNSGPYPH